MAPYRARVSVTTRVAKRLVIGSPVRSDRMAHALLPKRLALPIFASDALSSVAYATQEILLVLTVGGTAFLFLTPRYEVRSKHSAGWTLSSTTSASTRRTVS